MESKGAELAEANQTWRYRLLRYVPNIVSGEFYNLAVLLYDADGVLVDARFTREFKRIACHPLADVHLLERLREEFEERLLSGEGLGDYLAALDKRFARSFDFSPPKAFLGGGAPAEIERLYRQLVADPPRLRAESEPAPPRPGTRLYLRGKIDDAFAARRLFDLGVEKDREVRYGPDRAVATFDYAYRPNGREQYVHALALENDLQETMRLGFIKSRLEAAELSVVVDERAQGDVRGLLQEADIGVWTEPQLGELAAQVHAQLTS